MHLPRAGTELLDRYTTCTATDAQAGWGGPTCASTQSLSGRTDRQVSRTRASACLVPSHSGFILGPFMGLGMIVPGVMAERRVARLGRENGGA